MPTPSHNASLHMLSGIDRLLGRKTVVGPLFCFGDPRPSDSATRVQLHPTISSEQVLCQFQPHGNTLFRLTSK